jgi:hypothetical protein
MKKQLLFILGAVIIANSSCNNGNEQKGQTNKDTSQMAVNTFQIYKPNWGDISTYTQPHPKDQANPEIQDFIDHVYNANPDVEVKSFFINADTLRSYLKKNTNVNHLQVLLGLRTGAHGEKYRVYYIIGVDSTTKKQVYFKDGSGKEYVYQNCLPCPNYCNIVNNIDLLQ